MSMATVRARYFFLWRLRCFSLFSTPHWYNKCGWVTESKPDACRLAFGLSPNATDGLVKQVWKLNLISSLLATVCWHTENWINLASLLMLHSAQKTGSIRHNAWYLIVWYLMLDSFFVFHDITSLTSWNHEKQKPVSAHRLQYMFYQIHQTYRCGLLAVCPVWELEEHLIFLQCSVKSSIRSIRYKTD